MKSIGSDDRYHDSDGFLWIGFPPPNYNPEYFIDRELLSKHWVGPKDRWEETLSGGELSLFGWVRSYRAAEGKA